MFFYAGKENPYEDIDDIFYNLICNVRFKKGIHSARILVAERKRFIGYFYQPWVTPQDFGCRVCEQIFHCASFSSSREERYEHSFRTSIRILSIERRVSRIALLIPDGRVHCLARASIVLLIFTI